MYFLVWSAWPQSLSVACFRCQRGSLRFVYSVLSRGFCRLCNVIGEDGLHSRKVLGGWDLIASSIKIGDDVHDEGNVSCARCFVLYL